MTFSFLGMIAIAMKYEFVEEHIKLGIEESLGSVTKPEIDKLLIEFQNALIDYEKSRSKITLEKVPTREVKLGDKKLFDLSIGRRVLMKQLVGSGQQGVPVYSAEVSENGD